MKKTLYFTEQFEIPFKLYILIKNGKIREYYGANFTPIIMYGDSVDFPELKLYKTNTEFELVKISKYDRKELNIKGNYKIKCDFLLQKHIAESYIKLNFIEKFIIDYSLGKSIFHRMNFNQKIIGLIFISIPLLYFGFLMKSCENQSPKKEIDQSKKPVLTTSKKDTIIAISKAKIHSTKTTKFEGDSLH